MGGVLVAVYIWILVDLQSIMFSHPLYGVEVMRWHVRREQRGKLCAAIGSDRAARMRQLQVHADCYQKYYLTLDTNQYC